jgi:hypothetical protein
MPPQPYDAREHALNVELVPIFVEPPVVDDEDDEQ